MRKTFLYFAVTYLSLGMLPRSSKAATPEETEILRLERIITNSWLKHDVASIKPIIADDFQYWSYNGVRRSKADLLRLVESSSDTDTTVEQPLVRVYGDAAVFTARIIDDETATNGKVTTTKTCVTDVFVRQNGKWQLVASHETIIPK